MLIEIENHKKSKEALKAELEEEKQLCELIGLDYKKINNDELELKYNSIVTKTPAKTFTFHITTKDNRVKSKKKFK